MKENNIAISVKGLSKTFKLPHEKSDSLKGAFVSLFNGRKTYETQQVLKDISFDVQKGDFFGVVGRNGSGKSTLLKLLAGIYKPSEGAIDINGKLTPFIELGVGFNPELTGRENVFLNGALLGFSRKEMQAMYQEIVEFSELERFMDQKLKNYSSGMQVRLAFSIAIKAKNEILIFDEVLAVGDEAFQRKCLDVFEKYKAQKQTVILVTHEMGTVKKFCNRALLIDKGEILEIGDPKSVANTYSELNQQQIDKEIGKSNSRKGNHKLNISVEGAKQAQQSFKMGERMRCLVEWDDLPNLESVGINIFKESGEHITGLNSLSNKSKKWATSNKLGIEFELNITPGKYYVTAEAFSTDKRTLDAVFDGPRFTVRSSDKPVSWSGLFDLPHKWVD